MAHAVAAHRVLDARTVVARDPAFELPEKAVAEVLKDLETARTRVAPLIDPPESPTPAAKPEASHTNSQIVDLQWTC